MIRAVALFDAQSLLLGHVKRLLVRSGEGGAAHLHGLNFRDQRMLRRERCGDPPQHLIGDALRFAHVAHLKLRTGKVDPDLPGDGMLFTEGGAGSIEQAAQSLLGGVDGANALHGDALDGIGEQGQRMLRTERVLEPVAGLGGELERMLQFTLLIGEAALVEVREQREPGFARHGRELRARDAERGLRRRKTPVARFDIGGLQSRPQQSRRTAGQMLLAQA